ncbi:hypothetical protein Kpho01_12730 [Kitasatospora phosalacinea]|uniref:Uncharacterized protein n=1 Tax=Kitasatospora phosalacinea TaxID=2065 RepID=A0A9W6UML6_9ACTN|nr:hypothetical protein Kpho01_12730 [Kitasatospora phosalacinea]
MTSRPEKVRDAAHTEATPTRECEVGTGRNSDDPTWKQRVRQLNPGPLSPERQVRGDRFTPIRFRGRLYNYWLCIFEPSPRSIRFYLLSTQPMIVE